ncbi:MAG: AAA family ATPase [Myxococcales bacterium]|nr:AAA family ATPase [Myxococcales bacterium]
MSHTNVRASVIAVRDELAGSLLERQVAIDAAILALLTNEHLLLLGPPGTAKSLLVRMLCEHIDSAVYYERLLTRFSTPEELFGPLSLSALEQDRFQRVTAGTLVEADIGFVDEIFKANSAILNSLLTLINERLFHDGRQVRRVPLLSLFAASNETPEEGGLHALYDRFLLRVTVPYLAEDDSLRRLLEMTFPRPSATITLDQLRQAQTDVCQLPLGDDAREAIVTIKRELDHEGLAVSDRRWRACGRLVRAKAWLEGEGTATADHAEVLVHALWTEPSHIRVVERVVSKVANPLNLEAVELEDAAKDLYDQRPQPGHPNLTHALEPLLRQLSDIHTRLEQRTASVPESRARRARQAIHKIEAWHRALSQLALRSLSKLHMAPGAA